MLMTKTRQGERRHFPGFSAGEDIVVPVPEIPSIQEEVR
jgi:hypothetical protein